MNLVGDQGGGPTATGVISDLDAMVDDGVDPIRAAQLEMVQLGQALGDEDISQAFYGDL